MQNPIAVLISNDIPVHSYVAAIQHLNSPERFMTKNNHESLIHDLTNLKISFDDERTAKYTFLYLVQNIIKRSHNSDTFDALELLNDSTDDANAFITNNPWVFAVADDVEVVNANGKPRQKKGAKQELAAKLYQENKDKSKKEIIAIFIKEIDMTPAGAQTYFYNCKKKFGV